MFPFPDGDFANREETLALVKYSHTVSQATDFLVYGKTPDAEESD